MSALSSRRIRRLGSLAILGFLCLLGYGVLFASVESYYRARQLELQQIAGEVSKLKAAVLRLPKLTEDLTRARSALNLESVAFQGVPASAAGATLEQHIADLVKGANGQVRQSRIQAEEISSGLGAVVVSISFQGSHESLLAVLSGLQTIQPGVLVDQLSVQLDESSVIDRGSVGGEDGRPYRGDAILNMDLVARGLVIPSE